MKPKIIKIIKAKKYYIFYIFCIIIILYIWLNAEKDASESIKEIRNMIKNAQLPHQANMKYILLWGNPSIEPMFKLRKGQKAFIARNCPQINCFVITDKSIFDVSKYDVIIFHGKEIMTFKKFELPKKRSPHQLYIYLSEESSGYYPVEDERYNDFFNLTWTYRLNSDLYGGYVAIRNKKGEIIGPKEVMHWENINNMTPISENLKEKLRNKTKIAAWFVSNCYTPGKRELLVEEIQKELKEFGLSIDVYGWCGNLNCPVDNISECLNLIERDYYFYMSFENSFSEDYVTEKLLHALQHYAVPVVYGGANYTRFMPDGIYLDARKLGAKELVKEMVYLMNDKEKYYEYFKWHNYYSYHGVEEAPETDPYCKICSFLNEHNLNEVKIHHDFKKWWDPPNYEYLIPKSSK